MKKDKKNQPIKQTKKQTANSPEESKVMTYVLAIGTSLIILLVLALIIALIVTTVKTNRRENAKNPFEEVPTLTLTELNIILPLQPTPSDDNPNPDPVYPDIPELTVSNPKAYDQLIKQEYMILFYNGDKLTKELEALVLSFYDRSHENLGLVVFNIKNNETVLTDKEGPLAALLKDEKNLEVPIIAKLNLEDPSKPTFIIDLTTINQELAK